MALDEPKNTDQVFDIKGLQFITDKDFIQQAQPITIDFNGMGFVLDSSIELGQSGGCSGCGSSGSCG